MKAIEVNSQQVFIHGESIFLYGGEVHYFRLPRSQWRDRLEKTKAAGCNLISTYIPWLWHEKLEGLIDLTGETTPERDLAHFLDLVAELELYCLVRPGPYVMSELVNSGIPQWVEATYPQTLARTQTNEIHPARIMSYLEPTFMGLVEHWYQAVCQLIAPRQIQYGGPVIMFQLDNEVGMLQWVCNQADYHPTTLERFEMYCRQKWQTINEYNQVSGEEWCDFSELKQAVIQTDISAALHYEYRLFMRENHRAYIECLIAIAKKNGIDLPWIVNVHGFDSHDYAKRGQQYPIGLSQLLETAKIPDIMLAGDYYIGNIVPDNYVDITLANALTQAIQPKEQPLFSAEFQSGFQHAKPKIQPTTIDLTTRLCLANGMKALNYYMFAGGENYENIGLLGKRHDWQAPIGMAGELRRHYEGIRTLGQTIQALEPELSSAKMVSKTTIGFYPDYYLTEYATVATMEQDWQLKRYREAYLFEGFAKGLVQNNYSVKALNMLADNEMNVVTTPTLWMLSAKWMNADVQTKLVTYLENGGKLVIWPQLPELDFYQQPCTVLRDYLQVKATDIEPEQFGIFGKIDSVSGEYRQTYHGVDLDCLAVLESDPTQCCAFTKKCGEGRIIALGCGLEYDYQYKQDVLQQITAIFDMQPIVTNESELDISIQQSGETRFVYIHNFDDYEQMTTITQEADVLFAGYRFQIPARSGLLLAHDLAITETIQLVYSTNELVNRVVQTTKVVLEFSAQTQIGYLSLKLATNQTLEASSEQAIVQWNGAEWIVQIPANERISIVIQMGEQQ